MQGVVVHFVDGDVVPYITPSPIGEWIEFHEPTARGGVVCVSAFFCFGGVYQRHICTRLRLLFTQACDPRTLTFERARQGFHFANVAAGLALFHAFEDGVLPSVTNELQYAGLLRPINMDVAVRMRLCAL